MQQRGASVLTLLRRTLDEWRGAGDLWSRVDRLETLTAEEVGRLASDIGLTREELLRTVGRPGGSVELLHRRLGALGVDQDELRSQWPQLLAELERTCAGCTQRERCATEMAADPLPPGWDSYCPNSGTLKTLT